MYPDQGYLVKLDEQLAAALGLDVRGDFEQWPYGHLMENDGYIKYKDVYFRVIDSNNNNVDLFDLNGTGLYVCFNVADLYHLTPSSLLQNMQGLNVIDACWLGE